MFLPSNDLFNKGKESFYAKSPFRLMVICLLRKVGMTSPFLSEWFEIVFEQYGKKQFYVLRRLKKTLGCSKNVKDVFLLKPIWQKLQMADAIPISQRDCSSLQKRTLQRRTQRECNWKPNARSLFFIWWSTRGAAFSVAFFSRDTHRQILLSTDNELRMRITLWGRSWWRSFTTSRILLTFGCKMRTEEPLTRYL